LIKNLLGVDRKDSVFFECEVSHDWIAWHHAAWTLATIFDHVRAQQKDTELRLNPNQHQDGHYLTALSRAEAIATNESGEMRTFAQWMYGNTKQIETNKNH